MKHVGSITNIIEEMKGYGDIQVSFSGIIERKDPDLGEKINNINERLKIFAIVKVFSL